MTFHSLYSNLFFDACRLHLFSITSLLLSKEHFLTRFSYVTRVLLVGKAMAQFYSRVRSTHYVNETLLPLEMMLITPAQGQEFDITSPRAIDIGQFLPEKSFEGIDWWKDHECVFSVPPLVLLP